MKVLCTAVKFETYPGFVGGKKNFSAEKFATEFSIDV